MRKTLVFTLALLMILSLCGCGSADEIQETVAPPAQEPATEAPTDAPTEPPAQPFDFAGSWVDVGAEGFTIFDLDAAGTGSSTKRVGRMATTVGFAWTHDDTTATLEKKVLGATSFTANDGEDRTMTSDMGVVFIPLEVYKAEYVVAEIVNNEGQTENLVPFELLQIEQGNELRFEKLYQGAQITIEDTVLTVNGAIRLNGRAVQGYLELDSGWVVELSEDMLDAASMLNVGDRVRITGNLYSATEVFIEDGHTVTMEVM